MKKKIKIIIGILLLLLGIIMVSDKIISEKTEKYIYEDMEKMPENRVGLVLGTSKKLDNGQDNLYFIYRIQAAKKLYEAGKIQVLIVSGDNSRVDYNEAEDMKNDLIKEGIPEDSIYLDYAGFRTLDSVLRMKNIFSQDKFTIISQKFHNERAIFIARHYNLDAIGYNARDVDAYSGFKTKVREKLARVKVFIDFMMNKQPKYSGNKIEIR